MRYRSKRQSNKDVTIYSFEMGKNELMTLIQLLEYTKRKTPKTVDTVIFHSRISTMMRELNRVARSEDIKRSSTLIQKEHHED